jgi:hypothetical protein
MPDGEAAARGRAPRGMAGRGRLPNHPGDSAETVRPRRKLWYAYPFGAAHPLDPAARIHDPS